MNSLPVGKMEGQYLSFSLKGQNYAVPIGVVKEINQMSSISLIPRMPAHVVGVINLRGKVIPVVDLRLKFELEAMAYTPRNCIIVIEGEAGEIGVVVDQVNEVLDFQASQIEAPPTMGDREKLDFVRGIGKLENKVVILLDIARALNSPGIGEALKRIREGSAAPVA